MGNSLQQLKQINGYMDSQKPYSNLSYGKRGNVPDNGCGFIACYNALKHLGHDVHAEDVYQYFNHTSKLVFRGHWGTNPLSVKKYLREKHIHTKMFVGKIPKKQYKMYIILNVYRTKKRWSAHYAFGVSDAGSLKTYNPNGRYKDIRDYLKKNDTVGRLFVVWGVGKVNSSKH
ncbi:MAG: hypothetical protein KAQ68_04530 [Clostridiales bacterium]|nr:hypothetical protein [Clostridiales bacterium]